MRDLRRNTERAGNEHMPHNGTPVPDVGRRASLSEQNRQTEVHLQTTATPDGQEQHPDSNPGGAFDRGWSSQVFRRLNIGRNTHTGGSGDAGPSERRSETPPEENDEEYTARMRRLVFGESGSSDSGAVLDESLRLADHTATNDAEAATHSEDLTYLRELDAWKRKQEKIHQAERYAEEDNNSIGASTQYTKKSFDQASIRTTDTKMTLVKELDDFRGSLRTTFVQYEAAIQRGEARASALQELQNGVQEARQAFEQDLRDVTDNAARAVAEETEYHTRAFLTDRLRDRLQKVFNQYETVVQRGEADTNSSQRLREHVQLARQSYTEELSNIAHPGTNVEWAAERGIRSFLSHRLNNRLRWALAQYETAVQDNPAHAADMLKSDISRIRYIGTEELRSIAHPGTDVKREVEKTIRAYLSNILRNRLREVSDQHEAVVQREEADTNSSQQLRERLELVRQSHTEGLRSIASPDTDAAEETEDLTRSFFTLRWDDRLHRAFDQYETIVQENPAHATDALQRDISRIRYINIEELRSMPSPEDVELREGDIFRSFLSNRLNSSLQELFDEFEAAVQREEADTNSSQQLREHVQLARQSHTEGLRSITSLDKDVAEEAEKDIKFFLSNWSDNKLQKISRQYETAIERGINHENALNRRKDREESIHLSYAEGLRIIARPDTM